jgi:4-amino-4-deoxy-L-arabinose transferase-like glycosyltransferase
MEINNISDNKSNILFLFIFLVAAALMIFGFDRSPMAWGDEVNFCEPSRQVSLGNNLSSPIHFNLLSLDKYFFVHPPVYCYVQGFLFKIIGFSQIVYRSSGIAFYLISIVLVYVITLKLLPAQVKNPGLWANLAAFIFAFDKEIHKSMRSGRCDSLAFLLTIITIFLIVDKSSRENKYYYLLAGITAGLAALTHPTLIFLIFALLIYCFTEIRQKESSWNVMGLLIIGVTITAIPYLIYVLKHFDIWQQQFLNHCSTNVGHSSFLSLFFMHFITVFKYMPFLMVLSVCAIPYCSLKKHGFILIVVLTMLPLWVIGSHNSYVKFSFPAFFILTVVSFAEIRNNWSNIPKKSFILSLMIILVIFNSLSYPLVRSYLLYKTYSERDPQNIDAAIKKFIPPGSKVISTEIAYFSCIKNHNEFRYPGPLYHYIHKLNAQLQPNYNENLKEYYPNYMILKFEEDPNIKYNNILNAKYKLLYSINIPSIKFMRYDFFPIAYKIWKVEYN